MRRLKDFNGGRRIANEDFAVLQDSLNLLASTYARPNVSYLVSGGAITRIGTSSRYMIAEAVISFNGLLVDFPTTNFELTSNTKIYLDGPTENGIRPFDLDGVSRAGWEEYSAQITNGTPPAGAPFVSLNAEGWSLRLDHFIDPIGTIKMVRLFNSNAGSLDPITGRGSGCFANWAICDGQNGTPDLRDRFPIGNGSSFSSVGQIGGEETVTLTGAQSGVQPHTHGVSDPGHSHNFEDERSIPRVNVTHPTNGSEQTLIVNSVVKSTGSSTTGVSVVSHPGANALQAHNNLPPFMRLIFIMKIS